MMFALSPRFRICLYSETSESKERVVREAEDFCRDYTALHPEAACSERFSYFFRSLRDGAFWRVIECVDGSNHVLFSSPEQASNARKWAHEHFANEELERILNICVNTALLIPRPGSCPGFYKGHSILLRDIVQKDCSMFKEAVDGYFRARLVNGCFWEEIVDMSGCINHGLAYGVVDSLLSSQKLDPCFAGRGFKIFYRNNERNPTFFDLHGLSAESIEAWIDFARCVESVRVQAGVEEADVAQLVRPYVLELLNFGAPGCGYRFADVKRRLADGFVRKYCSSGLVRSCVLEELKLHASYSEQVCVEVLPDFISALPDSEYFVSALFAEGGISSSQRIVYFGDLCAKAGLEGIMSGDALARIESARKELAVSPRKRKKLCKR